jgi:hypothetical protein
VFREGTADNEAGIGLRAGCGFTDNFDIDSIRQPAFCIRQGRTPGFPGPSLFVPPRIRERVTRF